MPQSPAARDSLRAVLDSVFRDPAYRWREPEDFWAPIRRAWAALLDGVAELARSHPTALTAITWVLIAILVAVFVHAGWVVWQMVRGATASADAPVAVPPPRGADWYRADAERLAGAGRYREAMQADFTAVVLTLDARRRLRFHPSKTPGEYAREHGPLTPLVRALYAYLFARAPCGAPEYAEWRALTAGAIDGAAA